MTSPAHLIFDAPIRAAVALAFAAIMYSSLAHAQNNASASYEKDPAIGDAPNAAPGLYRLGVAAEGARGFSFAGTAGFGYTESVLGTNDSHYRIGGSLSAAIRPVRWLTGGVQLNGRYDKHVSVPNGSDDGFIGDPKLFLRAGKTLDKRWHLGVQTVVWFPGDKTPSIVPKATTFDFEGLAAYAADLGTSELTFATRVGYRLDNSANSATNVDQLSRADRLALDVSSFNSVLLGAGAVWQMNRWEVLGEWTWQLLTGANNPGASKSPMNLSGGVRFSATADGALRLGLMVDTALSSRPTVDTGQPLVPVPPRIGGLLSLLYRWPVFEPTREKEQAPVVVKQEEVPPKPVEPPKPTTGGVKGRVVDVQGAGLAGAQIHLGDPSTGKDVVTNSDGVFEASELLPGLLRIAVKLDGYQPTTSTTTVSVGKIATATVALVRIPRGQLRGMIRAFDGKRIEPSVRIEQLNPPQGVPATQITNVDSDGAFQANLDEGDYQVFIEARGYAAQKRKVKVEDNGVTVLNVDLRRRR